MKVYPHYWIDDGRWEFTANEWKENAQEVDIPDEVLKEYEAATERFNKASKAVADAAADAGYDHWSSPPRHKRK